MKEDNAEAAPKENNEKESNEKENNVEENDKVEGGDEDKQSVVKENVCIVFLNDECEKIKCCLAVYLMLYRTHIYLVFATTNVFFDIVTLIIAVRVTFTAIISVAMSKNTFVVAKNETNVCTR